MSFTAVVAVATFSSNNAEVQFEFEAREAFKVLAPAGETAAFESISEFPLALPIRSAVFAPAVASPVEFPIAATTHELSVPVVSAGAKVVVPEAVSVLSVVPVGEA